MDRLAGKTYFVQKKHLKTPKIMDNFSDRLTLEGAGGQTGVIWSTVRVPLKSWGHNASFQICGMSSLSKVTSQQSVTFLANEHVKITRFFVKRSVTENF